MSRPSSGATNGLSFAQVYPRSRSWPDATHASRKTTPGTGTVTFEVRREHVAGVPERVRDLLRLAAAVVLPHLLQRADVGVDAAERRLDRGCACFPRSVAAPDVPARDPHPGRCERPVARV